VLWLGAAFAVAANVRGNAVASATAATPAVRRKDLDMSFPPAGGLCHQHLKFLRNTAETQVNAAGRPTIAITDVMSRE